MWVKICGIKRLEDALWAAECGAEAIGLLVGQMHPSDDFIAVDRAAKIARGLPDSLTTTLVTHLTRSASILELAKEIAPKAIQLHSDISPEQIVALRQALPGTKLFKAYHVIDTHSLSYGASYQGVIDSFVLDTVNRSTGQVGGTGQTHDWQLSKYIAQQYRIPVILAGGLTPLNVARAIVEVRPFGVDVNSGVKGSDGLKEFSKVKAFISAAKSLNTAT